MTKPYFESGRITTLALDIGAKLAERAPKDEINVLVPDEPTARDLAAALRRRRYFAKASMALVGGGENDGDEMHIRHYVRTYRRG